jgi:hypothetical protein
MLVRPAGLNSNSSLVLIDTLFPFIFPFVRSSELPQVAPAISSPNSQYKEANADANGPIRFATVTRSNETVMTSVAAGINPTDHIQLDFIPSPYASKPGSFDEHTKDKAEFGSA